MREGRAEEGRGLCRIGLLTYHRSVNDGSVMQAYSLYQLLQRELPEALIEIIDYMPASLHHRHWRLALYAFHPPFFNPRYVWSYYNQIDFLRRHCRFSREQLISNNLEEAQHFISRQGYNAVVVGSDNTWELERAPHPPNPYFRPSPGIPTFAFAPSADPAPSADSLWCSGDISKEIKHAIDSFEIITVRDNGTSDFLNFLGIAPTRIGFLPDPTLLWDFSEHLEKQGELESGKKPVAALAASPRLGRLIHRYLVNAGFEVVSLMGARQLDGAISPPQFATIQQRLGLYPCFDVTISDRFHMSIFALKHGRGPVIFLEDTVRWPCANSKGRDLFTRLELQDMVWRLDEHDASPDKLHALLSLWPQVSRGLTNRLTALREDAKRTSYSGIILALKAIVAGGPTSKTVMPTFSGRG